MDNVKQQVTKLLRTDGLEEIICVILSENDTHVLLSEFSNSLDFDGLILVPLSSIVHVTSEFNDVEFYEKLLRMPSLELQLRASTQLMAEGLTPKLEMLADRHAIVSVECELVDPGFASVGWIDSIIAGQLNLAPLSARGIKYETLDVFKIEDVTKIEFDTRYIRALAFANEALDKTKLPIKF